MPRKRRSRMRRSWMRGTDDDGSEDAEAEGIGAMLSRLDCEAQGDAGMQFLGSGLMSGEEQELTTSSWEGVISWQRCGR